MSDLFYGNSLNYMREKMSDNSVDLIVTDPPYEVTEEHYGGKMYETKKMDISRTKLTDANITDGYDIKEFGKEFLRVMKTPNIYIWCNKKQIPMYFDYYVNEEKCLFEILCWHKTNALPTFSNKYLTDTEYCLYFHKGEGKTFPQTYEEARTYFLEPINQKDKEYNHPTIKPLKIIELMVKNSSRVNEVVFDPFMGSGTTGVACNHLGREFIGCEINKEFYDISVQRIELDF